MTLGYRLSPNEEHQLLKDENERRRKLRLIQVINNRSTKLLLIVTLFGSRIEDDPVKIVQLMI